MKHTMSWVDIPVSDLDRAITFYSALLDEPVQKKDAHGFEFGLLPHEDDNVSGCLCVMEDRKPSQDGLLVYLNVEGRLGKAVEIARQAGSKILTEPEQVGPYGHRAVIVDSEGNAVALYSKEASA
ncbi:MAG: VOC family protein [Gammaproteobacteria bacterium]|nr:VOC family protein [Gammaproteobacteria bacterium]